MKYIKKFNESGDFGSIPSTNPNTKKSNVKQYTKEELDEMSIRDRINYDRVISAVAAGWRIPEDIITAVVVAMHGSFDQSEEYLSDMDAYSYTDNPGEYWKEWCEKYDIEHEIDSNPFE